jgi:hypothetical protein
MKRKATNGSVSPTERIDEMTVTGEPRPRIKGYFAALLIDDRH